MQGDLIEDVVNTPRAIFIIIVQRFQIICNRSKPGFHFLFFSSWKETDVLIQSLQGAEATLTELLSTPVGELHEADQKARTPLRLVLKGGGTTLVLASRATMSTLDILEEVLFTSSGDGGWAVGGGEWSRGK